MNDMKKEAKKRRTKEINKRKREKEKERFKRAKEEETKRPLSTREQWFNLTEEHLMTFKRLGMDTDNYKEYFIMPTIPLYQGNLINLIKNKNIQKILMSFDILDYLLLPVIVHFINIVHDLRLPLSNDNMQIYIEPKDRWNPYYEINIGDIFFLAPLLKFKDIEDFERRLDNYFKLGLVDIKYKDDKNKKIRMIKIKPFLKKIIKEEMIEDYSDNYSF